MLVALTSVAFVASLPSRFSLAPAVTVGESNDVLFVVNFLFFAGAAAGCMIVAAVASALRSDSSEQISRISEVTAIGCLALATMFFVLVALVALEHRPSRTMAPGGSRSPAVWDAAILTIYLGNALALGYIAAHASALHQAISSTSPRRFRRMAAAVLVVLASVALGRKRELVGHLATVMIPAAVLLSIVPVWMSALLPFEPAWYPVAIGALFYVSALSVSLALVVVAAVFGRMALTLPIGDRPIRHLGTLLGIVIPVLGYCLFAEMHFVANASDPVRKHVFQEIVAGPYAPAFWLESIAGVLIPAVLLFAWSPPSVPRIGLAAFLVSASVLGQRWYLVIPASLGHVHRFYSQGGFAPLASEVVVTLAVYGVGFFVYLATARRFLRR